MKNPRLLIPVLLIVLALAVYFRGALSEGYHYITSALVKGGAVEGRAPASRGSKWAEVGLTQFTSGLELPVDLTHAGDGSGRIFVVEKPGRIKIVRDGKVGEGSFLDIVSRVRSRGTEQGLLGLAFHPKFPENGRFFVNYTDLDGDTVVSEFGLADDPDRADPGSERVLIRIEQPASNHNGGQVRFGPDGYLYIGMGDGGSAGDPWGNAQNLDALLGKILRLDVDGEKPYAIPADNPFKDRGGARPEIWAYGLRNPWRFSFDLETGDMYIGDVGQNLWEEINFQPRASGGGENYGWDYTEGSHEFEMPRGHDTGGITFPVFEYGREDGCSVTGGYVYRGKEFPALAGTYLFSDFCTGKLWGLRKKDGGGWEWTMLLDTDLQPGSFGEGPDGSVYILDFPTGKIFKITVEK
ncbi:MAG TPA: PQQ-dependent sugar dehydrogenase [Thermodesulfobacteriota bacterium]|nr:PQQ-dependent sugar dehydrogenase [Thermodesulfobacteriota bacterium]